MTTKKRAESDLYVSRIYRNICVENPEEYSNYNVFKPNWKSQENYAVLQKIGRGKYSDVFEGVKIIKGKEPKPVVIKILKPVKKKKIRREIMILRTLNAKVRRGDRKSEDSEGHPGAQNIIHLLEETMDPHSKTKCLIFEFVDACDFKTLFPNLSDTDIRYYMFQLLQALDFCHSKGIIHRDVKPHNVMIDHRRRKLRLIDWGLAEFYHPGKEYNVRVASRYFKGPELLVGYRNYDYSLDIWSFGCMLAGMVFIRHPFFHGKNNEDQLVKITRVLGTAGLYAYLSKYNLGLPSAYEGLMKTEFDTKKPYRKRDFKEFVDKNHAELAKPEALELLSWCLRYDHQARATCKEAMAHRYFEPVRLGHVEPGVDIHCQRHPQGHGVRTENDEEEVSIRRYKATEDGKHY
ncbi:hypothetical protein AAMO2058_000821800 [Amorphochlora amoebiformis]